MLKDDSNNMYVTKRNGRTENVQFDKITERIQKLIKDHEFQIDASLVAQKTVASIFPGITTEDLDIESAKKSANLSTTHPLYSKLAGRILVSNLHKKTPLTFVQKMNNIQKITSNNSKGNIGLLNSNWLDWLNQYDDEINNLLNYDRDYDMDFFGFKTLERAYLLKDPITKKIYERPQDMWMRVASFLNQGDIENTKKTYDMMSQGFYTHASPTLYNSGSKRSQMSSCFLIGTDDSIDGITKTWSDVSRISKWAGGIGIHVSNIRAKDSIIRGTNGPSSGIIPMLQVYNNIARYINQCFTDKTIVYTKNGPKEIKDVRINDEIITNDGTFQKVKYVFADKKSDELLKINVKNNYKEILVTKKHPFYVVKNQKKITNYSTIINRLQKNIVNLEWCDAENLTTDDLIAFPIPTFQEDNNVYDEFDCFFYGMMIGDGHICKTRNECGLTLGIEKKGELIELTKRYLSLNNIHYWETTDESIHSIRWSVTHQFKFTRSQLYDNLDNKIIDPLFLHLPKNKILQIISGIIKTDGCIANEITLEMSSKNIIDSVRYILLRLGILSSGYCRDRIGNKSRTSRGEIITKKLTWVLRIPKDKIISDLLDIEEGKFVKYIKWNNYLLSRISTIEKDKYNGVVYDLEMSKNHNYLTEAGLVHNGGKRKGSFAIYLEPHHPDILDFLELRKNFGAETERARDLFLALWISDEFMNQVEADGDWYLMCPDKCPGLNDVYGNEFKELYWKYVDEGKYNSKISARKLFKSIMDSQIETGNPYILFKDASNNKSNQKNIGTIKSSNLCAEILEYSDDKETAVCNLASIAINKCVTPFDGTGEWIIYTKDNCNFCKWAKTFMNNKKYYYVEHKNADIKSIFNQEKITFPQILHNGKRVGGFNDLFKYTKAKYDFNKLYDVAYTATKNLDSVIDINFYPTNEAKKSNMRHRPIGLGIQGLADTLVLMGINFESQESLYFNSEMMETIYYAAMKASNDIAKERNLLMKEIYDSELKQGNYLPEFYDSSINPFANDDHNMVYHKLKLHKFEFDQFDSNCDHNGSYSTFKGSPVSTGILQFDMWNVKPKNLQKWNDLKEDIKKYGVRNSLVTALMPTASTSQILGNNECFEFFTNNIYTRRTLAGDFTIVNKYLVQDLIDLDLWSTDMKQRILADDSSIQNIKEIPDIVKKLYKIIWEIKQSWVLKNAKARAPYVDQTQSMNIFIGVPDYRTLYSCHMWSWKNGLKTGMYYLRSKPSRGAIKFTVDPNLVKKDTREIIVEDEQGCEMCSA